MIDQLYIICVAIMGIFAGSQLAEGALLVPYWKSLSSQQFFEQHQTFGPKVYRFFAPLTILATFFPIGTAIYATIVDAPGAGAAQVAAIISLAFFSTYYLYFKSANQAFAEAGISADDLPGKLTEWGNWHWARVGLEILALIIWCIAASKA